MSFSFPFFFFFQFAHLGDNEIGRDGSIAASLDSPSSSMSSPIILEGAASSSVPCLRSVWRYIFLRIRVRVLAFDLHGFGTSSNLHD